MGEFVPEGRFPLELARSGARRIHRHDAAETDAERADHAGHPEGAHREVVVLRELEDMSYRDIATVVGIPVGTVEALKEALAKAGKPAEFKIYPAAPHGFHADYRPSYRKEAAEDAWNQMQAWFKKYNVLG